MRPSSLVMHPNLCYWRCTDNPAQSVHTSGYIPGRMYGSQSISTLTIRTRKSTHFMMERIHRTVY